MEFFPPANDPVTFMLFYFLFNFFADPVTVVLKMSLMTSALLYFFIFIGTKLFKRLEKPRVRATNVNLAVSVFLMVIALWLFVRLWAVVNGGVFFSGTLSNILWFIVIGFAVGFVLSLIGRFLLVKMNERYMIPEPLYLFIMEFFMCLLFWVLIGGIFTILY